MSEMGQFVSLTMPSPLILSSFLCPLYSVLCSGSFCWLFTRSLKNKNWFMLMYMFTWGILSFFDSFAFLPVEDTYSSQPVP